MKTYLAKTGEVPQKWYLVNAEGKVLGRLASEIAKILRGKNKPTFTPHIDTGDFVVVVNAEKIKLTGDKWEKKMYYFNSGYHSGLRKVGANQMRQDKPEDIIILAVKGMLRTNRMRDQFLSKLKVYAGPDHPHQAQKPEPLEI